MTTADHHTDHSTDAPSINLLSIWRTFCAEWKSLVAIVTFFTAVATVLALVMTPVFRATSVVAPVESGRPQGGASALLSQFGGLAGLAGINLGGLSGNPRQGLVTLQSRSLMEAFITQHNLMPVLFEDTSENAPDTPVTLWRAVEKFKRIYSAELNPDTGLISVQVEWTDPNIAASWTNELVTLANEMLRQRDLEDAQRNLDFLNEQLSKTTVVGQQEVLYNLIDAEMKTLMLANGRSEYALTVIDPAVPPEIRSRPKRKQMVVLGALFGGIIATFLIAVRSSIRNQRLKEQK